MTSILFVCTANRFRSPLAEAAFRLELEKTGLSGTWSVGSAGTWTEAGLPPMKEALSAAQELGVDITSHLSRPISAALIKKYTLTLVMESGQKEALTIEFPTFAQKIYLLTEAAGGTIYDIPDPYSSNEPAWEVANEICKLIRDGFGSICQLAERTETNR